MIFYASKLKGICVEVLCVLCCSYNTTPTSSGRSSPSNLETQSTLSISQGGWTTGNTTERSSLDSSCYSLDVSLPCTPKSPFSSSVSVYLLPPHPSPSSPYSLPPPSLSYRGA